MIFQSSDQLRLKLIDTIAELENTRNVKDELLNMLEIAYKERDQAREQLQILVKKLASSNSNMFYEVQQNNNNNNVVMFQSTKAKSSITESNSPSHVSSPVDSFIEAVSSPEFSNVGVDSHNKYFFNQTLVHDEVDVASRVVDSLARGKVLPQKGKLLDAVINAGPLLQNLVLSGPLPTWKNPPPLSSIKIPPFSVEEDIDELNLFQNSTHPSFHSSGSLPIRNAADVTPSSCNNAWQFTSSSSLKKQKHQCF